MFQSSFSTLLITLVILTNLGDFSTSSDSKSYYNYQYYHPYNSNFSSIDEGNDYLRIKRDKLIKTIFDGYMLTENPNESGKKPVDVTVEIEILGIHSINVMSMEYTVDMYLRQRWVEKRLAWNKLDGFDKIQTALLITSKISDIWLPDLFFRNGKGGRRHSMTILNHLIRLEPNGSILYSQKLTMRFECQMYLNNFPMDKQICKMDIGSYCYTIDDLKFHWKDRGIRINHNVQISEFKTPAEIVATDCTPLNRTVSSPEIFSCLLGEFTLQRQLGSYLVGTYIPTILIVMVSWLSFWISMDALAARVSLGLLTLVSSICMGSEVVANLPRVSYIKSIDIWINSCLFFIIAAMLELGIASHMAKKIAYERWKQEIRQMVRQELARTMCPCPYPPQYFSEHTHQNNLNSLASPQSNTNQLQKSVGFKLSPELHMPKQNGTAAGVSYTTGFEPIVNTPSILKKTKSKSCNIDKTDYRDEKKTQRLPLKMEPKISSQTIPNRKVTLEELIDKVSVNTTQKVRRRRIQGARVIPSRDYSIVFEPTLQSLLDKTSLISPVPSSYITQIDGYPTYQPDYKLPNTVYNQSFPVQTCVPPTYCQACNPKPQSRLPISFLDMVLKENKTIDGPYPPNTFDIDSYSRIVFPIFFLLYNCFYWVYYLLLAPEVHRKPKTF